MEESLLSGLKVCGVIVVRQPEIHVAQPVVRNLVSLGLRCLLKFKQIKSLSIYETAAEPIQAEGITTCSEMINLIVVSGILEKA